MMRHGVKPTLDRETQEMVKADILKFYGFPWPEGEDFQTGINKLFDFLIAKHER